MSDKLYLHMGPGMNAHCERNLLATEWTDTEFWDQPTISDSQDAFLVLVKAVCQKVQQKFQRSQKPITLVGHSFGGHLAIEALKEVGAMVDRCELLSPVYDLPSGFLGVLKALGKDAGTTPELKMEIEKYLLASEGSRLGRPQNFWEYIQLITQDPMFFRVYWAEPDLFRKFGRVAASAPPLDLETFQFVLNDIFEKVDFSKAKKSLWTGPVEITFGALDPLVDVEREDRLWKSVFPQAQVRTLPESGHYLHLEDRLRLHDGPLVREGVEQCNHHADRRERGR